MARFAAHDLSNAALGGPLRIRGDRFVDAKGRTLHLRGLNVSGASKLPTSPNGLSHLSEGFYDHRTVSFVGRPFPLSDAPFHFSRLRAWGTPLIRLLVTWESLAHAGPDSLDEDYIDYLGKLIELMAEYGLKCFVCAHQDVWSRFSGGSGAPGWTFEAAGLEMEAFTDTGAAYVHSQDEAKRRTAPPNEREPSGPFVWPSGYQKLAAATMATLFWAGDAFAPDLRCDGVPIQSYLQDAYLRAFGALADRVGGLEACIGFEAMNEPHRGLINLHDFHKWNYDTDLHIGPYPSLAQSLALGSGYAQKVPYYVKSWPLPTRVSHQTTLDPCGRSAWRTECVWKQHGVWEWDPERRAPVILQYDYFNHDQKTGRKVEWYDDFYAPFLRKFAERVNKRQAGMSFVEPIPNEFMPPWLPTALDAEEAEEYAAAATTQSYSTPTLIRGDRPAELVYAPHFYDLNVLFSKHHAFMSVNVQGLARGMFFPRALYFGVRGLGKNYARQLGNVASYAFASLGRVPVVVGEVGIPYDLNGGHAFRTGDYGKQRELMHALIGAMEQHTLHYTLWNYNPDNTREHGDGWNKEDFSLVSNGTKDRRNDKWEDDELFQGGRVLDVVVRPYAAKLAGVQTRTAWNDRSLRYELEWKEIEGVHSDTTEIFLPQYHYGSHQIGVTLSDGEWHVDAEKQTLYVKTRTRSTHKILVEIKDEKAHMLRHHTDANSLFPGWLQLWLAEWTPSQVISVAFMLIVGLASLLVIDTMLLRSWTLPTPSTT